MKTAFVVQYFGQYGQSANSDFFLVLADIDPVNASVLSRFYMHINDKIETFCHCRLMRQNG
jgi:hypothetical protein